MPRWRFPFALGLGLALACSPDTPTSSGMEATDVGPSNEVVTIF